MLSTIKRFISAPKDRDQAIKAAEQHYHDLQKLDAAYSKLCSEHAELIVKSEQDAYKSHCALEDYKQESKKHIEALVGVVRAIRHNDLPPQFHAARTFANVD